MAKATLQLAAKNPPAVRVLGQLIMGLNLAQFKLPREIGVIITMGQKLMDIIAAK